MTIRPKPTRWRHGTVNPGSLVRTQADEPLHASPHFKPGAKAVELRRERGSRGEPLYRYHGAERRFCDLPEIIIINHQFN